MMTDTTLYEALATVRKTLKFIGYSTMGTVPEQSMVAYLKTQIEREKKMARDAISALDIIEGNARDGGDAAKIREQCAIVAALAADDPLFDLEEGFVRRVGSWIAARIRTLPVDPNPGDAELRAEVAKLTQERDAARTAHVRLVRAGEQLAACVAEYFEQSSAENKRLRASIDELERQRDERANGA
jgi:hypothetical protein